ncbi:MAG: hypothetical protein XD40_2288, partial [Archaeoglobus fulgidus]
YHAGILIIPLSLPEDVEVSQAYGWNSIELLKS